MSALDLLCATGRMFSHRQHFSHVWKTSTCCKKVCNHSGSVHKSCDPFLLLFLKWVPKLPPMLFWWTEVNFCQFLPTYRARWSWPPPTLGCPRRCPLCRCTWGYSTVQYSTVQGPSPDTVKFREVPMTALWVCVWVLFLPAGVGGGDIVESEGAAVTTARRSETVQRFCYDYLLELETKDRKG